MTAEVRTFVTLPSLPMNTMITNPASLAATRSASADIVSMETPTTAANFAPLNRRVLLGAAGLLGAAALTRLAAAGPLSPPAGAVSFTGKTAEQIEPRIDIETMLSGSGASRLISAPGSYILTRNLTVPDGQSGIRISASDVTLDLNGFALSGGPGSPAAIFIDPSPSGQPQRNVTVRNGSVAGTQQGVYSLLLGRNLHISNLTARDCSDSGFRLRGTRLEHCGAANCNTGFTLNNCHARNLGVETCPVGISATESVVDLAHVYDTTIGVDLTDRSVLADSVIDLATTGIRPRNNCIVRGCAVFNCLQYGIDITSLDGLGADNFIEGNLVSLCQVKGIRANGAGIIRNVLLANRGLRNGLNFATSDSFEFAGNNKWGPIVLTPATGDVGAVPNADHPLANLAF
ncbi:hypothetical protein BH11PLA1_BH11PLA1_12120 [soil metagenome]